MHRRLFDSHCLVTANYALFQAANNTGVIMDVSPGQRGVISGMLDLSRSLGLITGASVIGAVFAFASHAGDYTAAQPEAVATGMRVTFGVGQRWLSSRWSSHSGVRRSRGPRVKD
jgi:hypothetical protein